jgi:hypothetical protein
MQGHLSPHSSRFRNVCTATCRIMCMCLVATGLALLLCSPAHAQGGVPLVTVATDQTPLPLSDQFGIPAGSAINQAGDFAFVGNGGNALFLRPAGSSMATRLLQVGDEIPGITGSHVSSFSAVVGLNSSKILLFGVAFSLSGEVPREALLTYDGLNYHVVVSSTDIAPAPELVPYGSLTPGSINDEGDVNFAAFLVEKPTIAFYIIPSGKPVVRVVGLADSIPAAILAACTWCSPTSGPLGGFFGGIPTSSGILVGGAFRVPPLNAKGQMVISLWGGLFIGSKDLPLSLVALATSGPCGPPAPPSGGTITGGPVPFSLLEGTLNNLGAVAFVDIQASNTFNSPPISSALCFVPAGGAAALTVEKSGDPAPAAFPGGGTLGGPSLLAMNDSGDIAFSTFVYTVSTAGTTGKFALFRYHQSSKLTDVVAYNGEPVPGTNGVTFASPVFTTPPPPIGGPGISLTIPVPAFSGVSMANDGLVSFHVQLDPKGNAICQQTGTAPPILVSQDGQAAPVSGGGTFDLSVAGQTITLNNDSTFYFSYLTGGTSDFGDFLAAQASVHSLMSTGDSLPSGARTTFVSSPKVAGTFIAFLALPAGGRTNLLETDISTDNPTTRKIVSDGDIHVPGIPGLPSATSVSSNFFVNEIGETAFEIQSGSVELPSFIGVIPFGSGIVNPAWQDSIAGRCGAIYLWSPTTGSSTKVVAVGDMAPAPNNTTPFSCVKLNAAAPSPLNKSGQLAFSSPSLFPNPLPCFFCDPPPVTPNVNGVFLSSPGGTGAISEIAAANDTLPGETQPTTFVPYLSVPVNSAGQVAFGAQVGTPGLGSPPGFQAFFLRKAGADPQTVVSSGDNVPPGSGVTFTAPHYITGLDDNGNLTFTAGTSAAQEGIFFAPPGGPVQTIAQDGGTAPGTGGGSFELSLPPPTTLPPGIPIGTGNSFSADIALANGESDVVFRAGITGGTPGGPNSGFFRLMRAGPTPGILQPLVLQGQDVPGGGKFGSIPFPPFGAEFSLGPDGALAFANTFTSGTTVMRGLFVARPDGSLVKVLATGDTVPGGGTLNGLSIAHLVAGAAGKFAFWAGIKGGSARQAIFVTAIPPGTATATATLAALQPPVIALQPVTLAATVNSSSGATSTAPTGKVNFFDNGTSLGNGTLGSNGNATLMTSSLVGGPHTLVAQYDGDANFAPADSPAVDTVVTGFAPPPTGLAVTAGHTLQIPLLLYASAGSSFTFMLSCPGLPAKASCAFDQNPVNPGPSGKAITVTLSTMGNSNVLPHRPRESPGPLALLEISAALSALLAAAMTKLKLAPRRRLAFGMCIAAFGLLTLMTGCGTVGSGSTGPSGTPPGLAAITVTATSTTATVSTVVNVTVQ